MQQEPHQIIVNEQNLEFEKEKLGAALGGEQEEEKDLKEGHNEMMEDLIDHNSRSMIG